MHAILRMRFAFRETHSYCYSPLALSDEIYECHTLQYFLECRKDAGVGYVLGKQGGGGESAGMDDSKTRSLSYPRAYS